MREREREREVEGVGYQERKIELEGNREEGVEEK